MRKKEAVKWLH